MTETQSSIRKPVIALAIGDPAGIGPELAARVIADADVRAAADLIVIGDRRILSRGAEVAGVKVEMDVCNSTDELGNSQRTVLIDFGHLDPASIKVGSASREGGAFALKNFRTCIELAAAGRVGAVCFTPFNKAAMHRSSPRRPCSRESG
jgi:4-hydroxy-L-threonine phosphate dehydrogenase PdxA